MRDTRVREEHALGTLTVTAIADKFGLSRKHVQRILYGT
jgi:AraC-like DNA-binding protein